MRGKKKKKGRFTPAEFNAIVSLYLLTQGRGRMTANKAVLAIKALGLDCKLNSINRGFSTRGSRGKLPPDIFIAFDGKRYGAGAESCFQHGAPAGRFARSAASQIRT